MVTFEITYKMAENPPQPMSWEDYEKKLKVEWNSLLESKPSEPNVQTFLEKHPCLLPGPFTMDGKSGHYPFPDAVISKPPLSGIGDRIPDFMWLSTDSLELQPVLIEIEQPDKKWFTKTGNPTSKFTQAHNQLAQWKAWFAEPENQLCFYGNFQIPPYLRARTLKVSCVLIYGRRNEYQDNSRLNRIRAKLATDNEYLMSYDRLAPSADARELFTVKKCSDGYRAIAYPPTYVLSSNLANNYSLVNGKEETIDNCEWMSPERKEFIKSRLPYWEKWAKEDNGTMKGERE